MFLCEITGTAGELDYDIAEARLDLPDLSLARTLHMHIELMMRHHDSPELPAKFDLK